MCVKSHVIWILQVGHENRERTWEGERLDLVKELGERSLENWKWRWAVKEDLWILHLHLFLLLEDWYHVGFGGRWTWDQISTLLLNTLFNLHSLVAPSSSVVKRIRLQCRRHRFNLWVGKIPWRKKWQPPPVFLPGKSHAQRSLVGYGPWGHRESERTQQLNSNNKVDKGQMYISYKSQYYILYVFSEKC